MHLFGCQRYDSVHFPNSIHMTSIFILIETSLSEFQLQENPGGDFTFTRFPEWRVYKHHSLPQQQAEVLRRK